MDLIEKLNNLLNNNSRNFEVNNEYYTISHNTAIDISKENVAEKEEIYTDTKVEQLECESSFDYDEFQDCFIDDENNAFDCLSSSESEDIKDYDTNNKDSIEKFLNDCEKIIENSDEEKIKIETIQNEVSELEKSSQEQHFLEEYNINKKPELEVFFCKQNIDDHRDNNLNGNNKESDDKNDEIAIPETFSSKDNELQEDIFPENSKYNRMLNPDFSMLEKRINSVWKEIDEIHEQIKEEREISRKEAHDIAELIKKDNLFKDKTKVFFKEVHNAQKNIEKTIDGNKLNESHTSCNGDNNNNNNKIMETKGTNTFTSSLAEARINMKKEMLNKIKIRQNESEAHMFKKKLKEVEELCNVEMNKVTEIISQLQSLQFDSEVTNRNKLQKNDNVNSSLQIHKNVQKMNSNISLPDATQLKYLAQLNKN